MPVNGQCRLLRPDGEHIPSRGEMEYLGSALSADGSSGKELSRRICMAKARFLEITAIWKHSSLGRRRKLQIYTSLVESKLLYSLATLCLNVSERRRLDGFQNRCIRQILGIKPSFISRVSNHDVLQQAHHVAASSLLEERRLQLLGNILRASEGSPLKTASFIPFTLHPATERYVRRRGRPRKEWITDTMQAALQIF